MALIATEDARFIVSSPDGQVNPGASLKPTIGAYPKIKIGGKSIFSPIMTVMVTGITATVKAGPFKQGGPILVGVRPTQIKKVKTPAGGIVGLGDEGSNNIIGTVSTAAGEIPYSLPITLTLTNPGQTKVDAK